MNKLLIKNAKALLWKDGKFEISEQDIFINGNKIEKIVTASKEQIAYFKALNPDVTEEEITKYINKQEK